MAVARYVTFSNDSCNLSRISPLHCIVFFRIVSYRVGSHRAVYFIGSDRLGSYRIVLHPSFLNSSRRIFPLFSFSKLPTCIVTCFTRPLGKNQSLNSFFTTCAGTMKFTRGTTSTPVYIISSWDSSGLNRYLTFLLVN